MDKTETPVADDTGNKGIKALTIEREPDGRFNFKTDTLDTMYDIRMMLYQAIPAIDDIIRQKENEVLINNIIGYFKKARERELTNTGNIISPHTNKPAIQVGAAE